MDHMELTRPFRPEQIKWRLGATSHDKTSGIGLAYIDARDVMQRLDGVAGIENWQCRYPMPGFCEMSIRIGGEWVVKTNAADATQVEPMKGQASDSFKRAAVLWGIGRYLYFLPNNWSPIREAGRSHKLVKTPTLPSWALPDMWETVYPDMFQQTNYTPPEDTGTDETPAPHDDPLFEQANELLVAHQNDLRPDQRVWGEGWIAKGEYQKVIDGITKIVAAKQEERATP